MKIDYRNLTHGTQEALLQNLSEEEKDKLFNRLLKQRRHELNDSKNAMQASMAKRKRHNPSMH